VTPIHDRGTMVRMSGDAIRALVAALAEVVIEADRGKGALAIAQLAGLDAQGWLRLDELARRPKLEPEAVTA
jgi:hypothetical protein